MTLPAQPPFRRRASAVDRALWVMVGDADASDPPRLVNASAVPAYSGMTSTRPLANAGISSSRGPTERCTSAMKPFAFSAPAYTNARISLSSKSNEPIVMTSSSSTDGGAGEPSPDEHPTSSATTIVLASERGRSTVRDRPVTGQVSHTVRVRASELGCQHEVPQPAHRSTGAVSTRRGTRAMATGQSGFGSRRRVRHMCCR